MKKNLLLLAATFAFCLLLAEILLRVFSPTMQSGTTWALTPNGRLYGWAPKAKTLTSLMCPDDGHQTLFYTNSHGWKDVEHKFQKPAGTVRILVIGDSHTYGLVPVEEIYPRRLEAELKKRGYSRVEVISIAVGGWGTDQELEALQREGVKYQPDLVISQYCDNDLLDNMSPTDSTPPENNTMAKPFRYELTADGLKRISLHRTVERRVEYYYLCEQSSLLSHLLLARERLLTMMGKRPFLAQGYEARRAMFRPVIEPSRSFDYRLLYIDEPNPLADRAWELYEALLLRTREVCQDHGAPLVVFSESGDEGKRQAYLSWNYVRHDDQGDYDLVGGVRQPVDYYLPLKKLTAICQKDSIPLVPHARPYQRFKLDRHATAAGNEAMAQDITDFLAGWDGFNRIYHGSDPANQH